MKESPIHPLEKEQYSNESTVVNTMQWRVHGANNKAVVVNKRHILEKYPIAFTIVELS